MCHFEDLIAESGGGVGVTTMSHHTGKPVKGGLKTGTLEYKQANKNSDRLKRLKGVRSFNLTLI